MTRILNNLDRLPPGWGYFLLPLFVAFGVDRVAFSCPVGRHTGPGLPGQYSGQSAGAREHCSARDLGA